MHKNKSMWILAAAISFLLVASTVFAAPKVTKVELSAAVNAGYYAVVFNSNSNNPDGDGVWIDPGNTSGDSTTNPTGAAATNGQGAIAAEMFGLSSGYGQMLLSVDADAANYGTEMTNLNAGKPTNVNETILGGATGPVNKANIELGGVNAGDRAIPAGTEVTFTVDMNSEPPHLVAVMGGTAPTVTYDASGTGTLTIKTTTFGTTTNAEHIFYSIVGFSILTDTAKMGTTPLKIIAQTNAWVGDMFPLLPGFDTNAAVSDIGGTLGGTTAKSGVTIYGPTGQQRDIRIFFPDSAIATMFGSGVTSSSLTAFVGSGEDTSATIATDQTNFGTTGTLATFTYTFASPKDTSVGVDTSGGGGSSGCFIDTAR